MTREEAITVLKAFIENPLFSDEHKQAFNIAIHDIKQRQDWGINKLMLVPKTEWEQGPILDKIKSIVAEWKTDTWRYGHSYECMIKIAEIIDNAENEDKE